MSSLASICGFIVFGKIPFAIWRNRKRYFWLHPRVFIMSLAGFLTNTAQKWSYIIPPSQERSQLSFRYCLDFLCALSDSAVYTLNICRCIWLLWPFQKLNWSIWPRQKKSAKDWRVVNWSIEGKKKFDWFFSLILW